MNELVSVIIPTYKRNENLKKAIESVLKQTYQNIEIIVVDDNNPDTRFRKDNEKIMECYLTNSKVKYIKHEKIKMVQQLEIQELMWLMVSILAFWMMMMNFCQPKLKNKFIYWKVKKSIIV